GGWAVSMCWGVCFARGVDRVE
ncbi:unnamed protein product, partial [Rotaria sordida]